MANVDSASSRSRAVASWGFGTISFLFILGVFVFGPDELPAFKVRILAIVSAILLGFFAYFFTGTIGGTFGLQVTGGFALFLVVLYWWSSQLAPIKTAPPPPPDVSQAFEHLIFGDLPIYKATPDKQAKLQGKSHDSLMGRRAEGFALMANDEFNKGNLKGCIKFCDEALDCEPDYPWAHYIRSGAYMQLQDYEHAVDDLSVTIQHVPDFGVAIGERMLAYRKLGRMKDARADADTLCELGDCRFVRAFEQESLAEAK